MMMPDATMVKITMKSILAARVSNNVHSAIHNSRMQAKRMMFPVVIAISSLQSFITCKGSEISRQDNTNDAVFYFLVALRLV